jgi:hypothetical protein
VQSLTVEFDRESISVTLSKTRPDSWPTVISDLDPTTHTADPKSCFDLSLALREFPDQIRRSEMLLAKAITACYTPALIYGFESTPDRAPVVLNLIRIATDVYGDPIAMLALGKHLALNDSTRDEAFQMFGRAVDGGLILGLSCIGQLISPLSQIPWHHKDAVKAVELFEAVLLKVEDPIALLELSKLLLQGVGVPKNVERARELHARARREQPELPPWNVDAGQPGAQSPFVSLYRVLSYAAFAGAGVYVAFRIWQARHGGGL